MLVQLLQRNADFYPDDIAVSYGRLSLSHGELHRSVNRAANGLSRLGIRRGDRVALVLENCPEVIVSFFAVAGCSAINVPLNPDSTASELFTRFRNVDVKCVITDEQRVERVVEYVQTYARNIQVISTGERRADGAIPFSELLSNKARDLPERRRLDDDLVYLYSSGSTGRPKCVPRTVAQCWHETEYVSRTLGLSQMDVIFCAIPLFHSYGLVECMLAPAFSGARLVMLEKPSPFILRRNHVLRLLQDERVTVFPAVPLLLSQLANSSMSADLSALRGCLTGAASVPQTLFDEFLAKFGVPIRQHYGCAETGTVTINRDDDARVAADSVGHALPGVHIRLLDELGNEVPVGVAGDVAVRSRAITRGYLETEEVNEAAFPDGYFLTGDIGRKDEDGRLYLMSQRKFTIDVVGHKVDPTEVESVLAEHDCVSESVVIGVPNALGEGEIVAAYVVTRSPCDAKTLTAHCSKRLSSFKVPKFIHFISAVPKDALGKIVRKLEAIEALKYRLQ